MCKGGEEGAHSSSGVVRHSLTLGASLHHLLYLLHWPVLCVDDGPPDALGAGDGLGGDMGRAGLAVNFKPSTK